MHSEWADPIDEFIIPEYPCGACSRFIGHADDCPRQDPVAKPILDLTTVDGNAFSIIAAISKALRGVGASREYISDIRSEMMAGDYDHLLAVAMRETEMPEDHES